MMIARKRRPSKAGGMAQAVTPEMMTARKAQAVEGRGVMAQAVTPEKMTARKAQAVERWWG